MHLLIYLFIHSFINSLTFFTVIHLFCLEFTPIFWLRLMIFSLNSYPFALLPSISIHFIILSVLFCSVLFCPITVVHLFSFFSILFLLCLLQLYNFYFYFLIYRVSVPCNCCSCCQMQGGYLNLLLNQVHCVMGMIQTDPSKSGVTQMEGTSVDTVNRERGAERQ